MKRLVRLTFFVLIVLTFLMSNITFAASSITGTATLVSSKDTFQKEEEIIVSLTIEQLKTTKSVLTLKAQLEYDSTNLELVTNGIKNGEGWAAIGSTYYNPETGEFVTEKGSDFSSTSEKVVDIVFKAKTNAANNVNIRIKNIEVADGEGVVYLNDVSKVIKIEDSLSEPTKPSDNTNSTNNTNTSGTQNTPSNTTNSNNSNTSGTENTVTNTNTSGGSNTNSSNSNATSTTPVTPSENTGKNNTVATGTTNQNTVGGNTTKQNSTNKNNTTTTSTVLPYAGGNNNIVTILIIVAILLASICVIRIRVINKKIKQNIQSGK